MSGTQKVEVLNNLRMKIMAKENNALIDHSGSTAYALMMVAV